MNNNIKIICITFLEVFLRWDLSESEQSDYQIFKILDSKNRKREREREREREKIDYKYHNLYIHSQGGPLSRQIAPIDT